MVIYHQYAHDPIMLLYPSSLAALTFWPKGPTTPTGKKKPLSNKRKDFICLIKCLGDTVMKPLNSYGRRNPADSDVIKDKWEGNTPGTDHAKLNPAPESPAIHPDIHESGKSSP